VTAAPPGEGGATRRSVALIVFPGGFNWPIWVAATRGFFAAQGLDVRVTATPGSVHQWTSLALGEAQVAVTLMDNVIAYREGQGEAPVVVPDAIAVMGLDTRAMPALVALPDVRRYEDLRGRTLAVDAVKTGNALVLIAMLERGGLAPGSYRLARAGGVLQRFEALLRGGYAAALFNAPFDGLLRERGFTVLDTASSLLARFQGHVVAVRRTWADANRATLAALVRALRDALDWLYAPANREDALSIYNAHLPDADAAAAATAYSILFDAASGFVRDGALDVDGVAQVLALRAKYGEPRKALGDPLGYCDPSFVAEAAARRPGPLAA